MAQRTRVELVDDLDGTEIQDGKGETVIYGLDGATYEIDLSEKNAREFRKSFERYLNVSRKASSSSNGRSKGAARGKAADRGFDITELREWAAKNGITVAPRGRVKAEIVQQFLAAKK